MPLWSTSSSSTSSINPTTKKPSSASSSSKPPQLPPLGPFTPPSDSLPHFLSQHHRRSSSSSTTTTTTATTTKSKFKGKETFKEDFEDDPWQDGSDDELTVKKLEIATTTQHVEPTQSVTTSPTTGSTGGGGWFASLTGNAFASSSSSSTPTSTTTPAATKSKVLRRQPSAKDVAQALSPSNSPSFNSKPPPLPLTSNLKSNAAGPLLKRGGSYIVGVNAVQEAAVQIVKEEIRRNSLENGSELVNEAESLGNEKEDGVENKEAREGSEKDRLRKCIRGDIYELVKDPTSVLPRLRTEWLGRVPSPSSSFSPAAAPPITPSSSNDPSRRASISSLAEDGPDSCRLSTDSSDGPPQGYAPLNASSLSSSTTKKIVDYQKEYSSRPPDPLEAPGEIGRDARRRKKFLDVLQGVRGDGEEEELGRAGETDLGELRKLSWGGVTRELRPVVWSLLLGYLPSPFSRREVTLARKRKDYSDMVKLAFSRGVKGLDGPIWHQISIDVPRTRPGVKLWMMEGTQRSLERILYVWAIRHPASGYVQGINDLVTPFFQVFLGLYINSDPEEFDPALLPPEALEALEADSFWCLSKLLDGIQDNYIFAQPGITRAVKKMELLCKRVDAPLAKHLESEGVEFIQFAFRWMNCLLMRELSVENIVRMWDTYLAEGGDAFSEFHLYVCLSFLVKWSEQLRTMDFQSIIMFLQSLPTKDWKDGNTELLLSEAFMWSRTFEAR